MKVSKKIARSLGGGRPNSRPTTRKPVPHARASVERPRLVVGIGASAGGLNAFKSFLDNMPPDTGMAFVLVQHLDPHHKSMLVDLLATHTAMPVAEAVHGVRVAANHVFIIPPDATLSIKDGALEVLTPAPPRERRRPIDSFFTSLAEDQEEDAVCIILSGSGSDGSVGLRAIKELGGLCLAQAEFDATAMSGMPDSATATGLVDYVLPVEAMPAKLIEYQRHLTDVAEHKDADGSRHDMSQYLPAIAALLRGRIGHDFGQYKEKTLVRRIQRRMQVLHIGTVPDYVERLKKEPHQVEALYRDLLIGVTQFFRNETAFEALQATVIPKLLERLAKEPGKALRIWVPGCATGEEVYSIAIAVQESAHEHGPVSNVQIFGTDIDDKAVAVARAGRYAEGMAGVSPERLQRWFAKDGKDYCPIKPIRDMCVFSQHSIVKDPPFSQLDLISCRNLLIYLNAELQDKVLRIFHYALRPDGYLFLGPAEGITRNTSLFADCDRKNRIFQRRDDGTTPARSRLPAGEPRSHQSPPLTREGQSSGDRIDRISRRIMEKYSPVYVVVDNRSAILRFSGGELGPYLQPSSGKASLDLFSVLHKGLRPAVQAGLKAVRDGEQRSVSDHVAVRINGQNRIVLLIIEPIPDSVSESGHCIVAFHAVEPVAIEGMPDVSAATSEATVKALEQELRSTRAQLMATVDDLETSNEELKSANEEYQSINEEMQATNEELETSKEEMQSINEELQTVNGELNAKSELLAVLNSDLKNLLATSHIATVFLDPELRIKTFTPSLQDLFNVRNIDRGRPITELAMKLSYDDLRRDVQKVLDTLTPVETEVSLADRSGSFIMRIRSYLTLDRVVAGVVITFIDITERHKEEARRALLLNELNHRVKNTLATVLSIATQTLKNAPTPEGFRHAFMPRILALSRTHDLLTQAEWRKITLKDLALSELSPFQERGRLRWTMVGEDVWLQPQTILAIGMALHELATNAAKYGALSVPTGLVELKWEVHSVADGRRLHLRWKETGGPPVEAPTRTGFGLRLIHGGLAHELDGTAQLDFEPTGVRCTIDVPLVQAERAP